MTTTQLYRSVRAHVIASKAAGRNPRRLKHSSLYGAGGDPYYISVVPANASRAFIERIFGGIYAHHSLSCIAFLWRMDCPEAHKIAAEQAAGVRARALTLSRARRAGDPRVGLADKYATLHGAARKRFGYHHREQLAAVGARS